MRKLFPNDDDDDDDDDGDDDVRCVFFHCPRKKFHSVENNTSSCFPRLESIDPIVDRPYVCLSVRLEEKVVSFQKPNKDGQTDGRRRVLAL